MSNTELHFGKLELIEFPDEIDDNFISKIYYLQTSQGLKIEDIDIEDEYFYSDDVCKIGNKYYKLEDKEYDSSEDIIHAYNNLDGSISYILQYYNGGCSFGEALDEAVEKLSKNGVNNGS